MDCILLIRVFHVILGAVLAYIGYNLVVQNPDSSPSTAMKWTIGSVAILGVGAVGYHGYRVWYPGFICS